MMMLNWIQRNIYVYNLAFGLSMLDILMLAVLWFVFYSGPYFVAGFYIALNSGVNRLYSKWLNGANVIAFALAALFVSTAISLYLCRKRSRELESKLKEMETTLSSSLQKCASERQGRIRAQQALREALTQPKSDNLELTSYPMTPIGQVQSCFSTRNGTPRQPLIVPLARACIVIDSTRVPPAALEGFTEYSHCWILYVFHLNTDLDKLWKQPSNSKFKAKVRVPRLKGGRIGVFATRSPHRPCPIGLTVAKVEAVSGNMVLLSGVDLVDGTPILDVKPYLPYCDSIQGATVPKWVMEDNLLTVGSVKFCEGFLSSLADCWEKAGNRSLYASSSEFMCLIKQVLSWDIRSVSQRNQDEEASCHENDEAALPCGSRDVVYHLILEGMDVSYRIDSSSHVTIEGITLSPHFIQGKRKRCNHSMWIG